MKDQSAAALAGNNGFSLITNEKLIQLYASMVQCRQIEKRLRELLVRGNRCNPAIGLEATIQAAEKVKTEGGGGFNPRVKPTESAPALAAEEHFLPVSPDFPSLSAATIAGVTIDALPEDTVVSIHRDLAVEFLRGASLENCFQSLLAGAAFPTPASQFKVATAAARMNVKTGNGKIAVVFSGGGKLPISLWQQPLTQAQAGHLPIIFVLQNASLAELEGRGETAKASRKANATSVPSFAVDANDVVAVYRAATEALTHARKGNGPTIIECIGENARHSDPIAGMETYLSRKGLFSDEIKFEIAASFARQLDAGVAAAQAAIH
jgi:TPP-dependent pyruvate/acetoin dehydrogenase alpha subunit